MGNPPKRRYTHARPHFVEIEAISDYGKKILDGLSQFVHSSGDGTYETVEIDGFDGQWVLVFTPFYV